MRLVPGFVSSFLIAILWISQPSFAVPLEYKIEGLGFGNYGGNSFQMAPLTLIANADSESLVSLGENAALVANASLTIEIEGVGFGLFTSNTETIWNGDLNRVGFGISGSDGVVRSIVAVENALFESYDITTSLPTTPGASSFDGSYSFPTTFGELSWYSVLNPTVTTTILPEPANLAPLLPIFVLCLMCRRSVWLISGT